MVGVGREYGKVALRIYQEGKGFGNILKVNLNIKLEQQKSKGGQ